MFGFNLDWWNGALFVSLAVSALATAVVIKLQKQATTDTANEFARYKLQTAKEIADANARAAEADLRLAEYRKPRGPIIQVRAHEFVQAIKPRAPNSTWATPLSVESNGILLGSLNL